MLSIGYLSNIRFSYRKLAYLQQEILELTIKLQQQKTMPPSRQQVTAPTNTPQPTASAINTDILPAVNKITSAAHVTLHAYNLSPPQTKTDCIAYVMSLEIEGTYQQLLFFINTLLGSLQTTTIDKLFLVRKTTLPHTVTLQLTLLVHTKDFIALFPIPSQILPVATHDIFTLVTPQKNLALWTSQELRFLGILQHTTGTFALVSDPLSNHYQITVGDKIGLHGSTILAINTERITATQREDDLCRNRPCIHLSQLQHN